MLQSSLREIMISIHALREEGDPGDKITRLERMIFQSTPSARRATNIVCAVGGGLLHFNPRPPWGKRPDKPKTPAPAKQFQSAISTWKATTDKLIVYDEAYMISIHALREESDLATCSVEVDQVNFNPRPPRGERPTVIAANNQLHEFQSTPSARRATAAAELRQNRQTISIHALREESDDQINGSQLAHNHFNPRPPRGERQRTKVWEKATVQFQSTPSARRATRTARMTAAGF